MLQSSLRDAMDVGYEVKRERFLQLGGWDESGLSHDRGDAAIEALDHSVGLGTGGAAVYAELSADEV